MKSVNHAVATLAAVLCISPTFAQTPANSYLKTNLVSNVTGQAVFTDPNLVDPWGISFSATSPFWVSNHLSGTSTLYNGAGAINATVVTVPAGAVLGASAKGRPTGQVRNGTATAFLLPAPNGRAASFIFATEDGTIAGWNSGTVATVMIDNSARGAVYKALAIGTTAAGPTLYAANFRTGNIDVFNASWGPTLQTSFFDPAIPPGFAPFNIWNLNNNLYVTYAKQDSAGLLDVAGAGNGFVAVFDLNGQLLRHIASGGPLNSPWGIAIAPPVWGAFGGALIVGNFGDGLINAFDLKTGAPLGALQDASGSPIAISGLWALVFGNGGNGGDTKTLYFVAGVPNGSAVARGILGSIAPPAVITSVVNAASQLSGPVAPGEIVSILGQTVGPSPAVGAIIPPAVGLGTTLGTTSATVNGTPAPVMYTNGGQTNIQIPYDVAGSATVSIILKTGSQTTPAISVPVVATAPGIFTIDFSGKGQAVVLNADGTVNSAANPAVRDSKIWFFATGEGVTNPADTAGIREIDMTRVPVAPLTVAINGIDVTISAGGSTPQDVSGVLEMQITVPAGIPVGTATLSMTSGGVATTQPTTIFVK